MSISVTHLAKTYGSQVAVNNISFTIGKGEVVGFLGPNGAGKSTTMKMITGFLPADSGEIEVCGIKVSPHHIASHRKIGYLPEANPLYHDMYVREYLEFVSGIYQIKEKGKRIEEVIKMVGLTPESHKKIGQLSKGYKQRVGLAAALIHNPEVLILDEPTSGLDPNQIVEIRNVIQTLATNKTILFSSHIMQEVEAMCSRVIIIHKGNIVADDRLDALRGNEGFGITVRFSQPVDELQLQKINGVQQVQALAANTYSLHCQYAEPVKKHLLQFSIQHNLDIVTLQTESRSLENIFRSLTLSQEALQ